MADSQDAIGSVAEEAMKLVFTLSSNAGADEHVCTNNWCPLCQLVNYVRDNPEAVERVAQSAVGLARSVRDLIEQAVPPKDTAHSRDTAQPNDTAQEESL